MVFVKQFDCIISCPLGFHARPAGLFVKEASRFKSNITAVCDDKHADAKKFFTLISLGAKQGDMITVIIEGEDEQ